MGHNPVASLRADWQTQAMVLGIIALLGTLPFWLTDLDLRVAEHFYHPEADDPWYEGRLPLWSVLYRVAPLLAGLVLLGGVLILGAGGISRRLQPVRLYAVLVLATTLIGPGLLVNALFKDHWGRPRPHQLECLGGNKSYLPPLMRGEPGGGKSFPCGHSSVGYMLGVFYLIWRRSRPRLAWGALAGALALGTLLGIGRMAAGDHFLSDVVWSGIIAYGVAVALYFGLLPLQQWQKSGAARPPVATLPSRYPIRASLGYGFLSLLLLFGVLLATPVSDDVREVIRAGQLKDQPRVLRIDADDLDLIIYGADGPELGLLRLQVRGFGLPTARVRQDAQVRGGVVTYRVVHQGIFTERDTKLVVGLVAGQWDRVEARIGIGDILVHPLGRASPRLDLASADGSVILE